MFSTLKKKVALTGAGLALSVSGVALAAPAAPAQTVAPSQPHPVSVRGTALCGTRYLPSRVVRYQPAQSVRYNTSNETRFTAVRSNGRYSLTLRLVPRQGEQATATVFCRNRTQFNRFVFINGSSRSQTHDLIGVTRTVRGRP